MRYPVSMTKTPLLVIVGETASGKSALALDFAQRFNGEIICADSWTVYKGFDIGTAKPTAAERAKIPHHLLDIADPRDGYNAALFKQAAATTIEDIALRGKLPIMVGGTGLYVDSILYDYSFLDRAEPSRRAELDSLTIDALLKMAKAEGINLAGVDLRNKRRIIRAIENGGLRPTHKSMRQATLVLGLRLPIDELRRRVEARVDTMISDGLKLEVRQLAKTYGWGVEAMKGIGYLEWQAYFAGTQDEAETRQRIITDTMQLAKKQRTWFKRNKCVHWVDDRSKAIDLFTTLMNKYGS